MLDAKRKRVTKSPTNTPPSRPSSGAKERVRESANLPEDLTADPDLSVIAEEIAIYRAHFERLMRDHAGEFVLIKGSDIVGTFPDRSAALREGYRRFGVVSFLVRQIADPGPAIYLPNVTP